MAAVRHRCLRRKKRFQNLSLALTECPATAVCFDALVVGTLPNSKLVFVHSDEKTSGFVRLVVDQQIAISNIVYSVHLPAVGGPLPGLALHHVRFNFM